MTQNAQSVDYAALSQRLDEIVVAMQASDVSVDQAIAYYQEGMQLVGQLEQYLREAEHKIKKVKA